MSGDTGREHAQDPLGDAAGRVQRALAELGVDCRVVELAGTTRSAADAARTIGCEVGRIAKSLVFRGVRGGAPVLVVASGANRVDEAKIGHYFDQGIERADADYVREHTGFAIGGVPPVGHVTPLTTFIDRDLLGWETVWAAAGTANAVFEIGPAELVRITGALVADLRADS
jgi:prolyl-tRNA editing enzyme YbaK/EbsC (Cys-tRNA(Pro) deacylase)